jgi:hypothetical protein
MERRTSRPIIGSPQNDECYSLEGIIAGRSPLRLATLSLPTHREVVAAAFRISGYAACTRKIPSTYGPDASPTEGDQPPLWLPYDAESRPYAKFLPVTALVRMEVNPISKKELA